MLRRCACLQCHCIGVHWSQSTGLLSIQALLSGRMFCCSCWHNCANCRLAMLGVVSALALEFTTGKNVFQQVQSYPGSIAFVSLLFIVATMVPILRGVPRKGNFIFTSGRELINGRIAMLGFVALLATEYFSGGQTIPHFYGLLKWKGGGGWTWPVFCVLLYVPIHVTLSH